MRMYIFLLIVLNSIRMVLFVREEKEINKEKNQRIDRNNNDDDDDERKKSDGCHAN